jgi:hypothetical protein
MLPIKNKRPFTGCCYYISLYARYAKINFHALIGRIFHHQFIQPGGIV